MIHRFLIVSEQLVLTSTASEDDHTNKQVIELLMPIQVYWQVKTMIEDSYYLISSSEEPSEIARLQKAVFQLMVPFAVSESERNWLVNTIAGTQKK